MAIAFGLMLTGCSETSVTEPKADVSDYSEEMEGYTGEFAATMQEFSDLNMEASQNPPLMATDEWIMDVSLTLISMEEHIADIRAVEVPEGAPEEVEKSHEYVLKAMDSYEFAVDNYPDALGDTGLLYECIDAMEEGNSNIEKAELELSKISD